MTTHSSQIRLPPNPQISSRPRRWTWLRTALFLTPLGLGCGGQELPAGDNFKLSEVAWNGKNVDFGKISAVTEIYDDTLILSDSGANILTSGVLLASDTTMKS